MGRRTNSQALTSKLHKYLAAEDFMMCYCNKTSALALCSLNLVLSWKLTIYSHFTERKFSLIWITCSFCHLQNLVF